MPDPRSPRPLSTTALRAAGVLSLLLGAAPLVHLATAHAPGHDDSPLFALFTGALGLLAAVLQLALAGSLARSAARRRRADELRQLFEASPDAVLIQAGEQIVEANQRAARLLGVGSASELVGRSVLDFIGPDDREAVLDRSRRLEAGLTTPRTLLRSMQRADGTAFLAEVAAAALTIAGRPALQIVARDVTESVRLRRELEKVNAALRMTTACHEAIGRARTVHELLTAACRGLVDEGGYLVVWIGRPEQDAERSIRPLAWAGRHEDTESVVAGLRLTWEGERARGPVGRAVRTGRPAVTNAFGADPALEPWHAIAAAQGIRSLAAFPIAHGGERLGVLSISSAEDAAFGDEVVALLERLATDVGHAWVALRDRGLFAAVLEQAPFPIYVNGENGRLLLANRGWEETVGIPRDRVMGRPLGEVFREEDQATVLEPIQRVLGSGQAVRAEEELVIRGERRIYDTIRFPLPDADGRLGLVGGVSLDTTARRLAEESLAKEREFLRAVLDHAGVLVVVVDRAGTVLRLNREFERVSGFTAEELRPGGAVMNLIPPEERAAVARALAAAWDAGGSVVIVNDWITRGGVRRTIEWVNTVLPGRAGAPDVLVGVGQDVTERLRADEQLRESREQLRRLAARTEAAREEEQARIARDLHDELGQLLTGLKMNLRWIERRLGEGPGSVDGNELLDRAVATSELVDQTLASVQRIAVELRPGVLDRLGLDAALRLETRRFQDRTGVACTLDLPPSLPGLSPDAATALYRVAQEAVTNVARHARAERLRVRLAVEDGGLLLELSDDGVGFDPATLARPRGLGLLGMAERVTRLGGGVDVRRGEPRGTVVTARVPSRGRAERGGLA